MCCCRGLMAGLVLMVSTVSAQAQPRAIIGDPLRDARHTMQARKLLFNDAELASVNIGVIVTDRVALLWGPVPTAEVAFQAELCLRGMIELVEIRNELVVNDLLQPARTPLKIDIAPQFLPERLPPKLPPLPRPILGAPGEFTGQERVNKESVNVKVLSPAPLPMLGLPQLDESQLEFAGVIRSYLQSKLGFGSIQFEIKDRRVYLKAGDADAETLHEAARGLARLPSVEGVILLDKTSPR